MIKLLLTCEHGGNQIPPAYKHLFNNAQKELSSHKGWDIGALEIFNNMVSLSHHYSYSDVSRLLVELNRSLHHPKLFSKYSKGISKTQKQEILEHFYLPYREEIKKFITQEVRKGNMIVHISVHSFTPVLNGEKRNADIGFLYDPSKKQEKDFARKWKEQIKTQNGAYKIRMNYPYEGKADGLTTFLRKSFAHNYIGIELEINQQFFKQSSSKIEDLKITLYHSLASILKDEF